MLGDVVGRGGLGDHEGLAVGTPLPRPRLLGGRLPLPSPLVIARPFPPWLGFAPCFTTAHLLHPLLLALLDVNAPPPAGSSISAPIASPARCPTCRSQTRLDVLERYQEGLRRTSCRSSGSCGCGQNTGEAGRRGMRLIPLDVLSLRDGHVHAAKDRVQLRSLGRWGCLGDCALLSSRSATCTEEESCICRSFD